MINLNGEFLSNTSATLNITNRAIAYGDALFETLKVVNGKILFWEDHYFRLMSSMRILRMEIPMDFTLEYLEQQIHATIQSNGIPANSNSTLRVKLTVYRDAEGLYLPTSNDIGYFISLKKLATSDFILNDIEEKSYTVDLFKDHYVNKGLLATLKSTNRIINTLASIFAKENGYDNLLLLNQDKKVIEAINGNVFLIKENQVVTPPISEGCIDGILRKQLIRILNKHTELSLEERPISAFEIQKSDELFITNAIWGIKSVSRYRKKQFGQERAKELTALLNKELVIVI